MASTSGLLGRIANKVTRRDSSVFKVILTGAAVTGLVYAASTSKQWTSGSTPVTKSEEGLYLKGSFLTVLISMYFLKFFLQQPAKAQRI